MASELPAHWSKSIKPPVKHFGQAKLFLDTKFFRVPPKSFASDTALGDVFSQQCKSKQWNRYKVFIDNLLKTFYKNGPS